MAVNPAPDQQRKRRFKPAPFFIGKNTRKIWRLKNPLFICRVKRKKEMKTTTKKAPALSERFQFGETPRTVGMNLQRYAEIMKAFPWEVDPKTKTLWIPEFSGNRTACLNLNHRVGDWREGNLYGYNGNCETEYLIIAVPDYWQDGHVLSLASLVAAKLQKEYSPGNITRVLKADRIKTIREVIFENPELF